MIERYNQTVQVFPNNALNGEIVLYDEHYFFFDGEKWVDCGKFKP